MKFLLCGSNTSIFGTHRGVKGLRLITAYGIAAMLGTLLGTAHHLPGGSSPGILAGGFALWASVSEGRTTRTSSSRDLAILVTASALGAVITICLAPILGRSRWPGAELTLVSGAFLVGYLKRFGILGAGIGSQIYTGQLLASGAGLIAGMAAIVPRLLSGPAEHPALGSPLACSGVQPKQELRMGLQAAIAALAIVILNDAIGLEESAWAITACT